MKRDRKKDVLKTRDRTHTHTHRHQVSVSPCATVPHTCPVLSFQLRLPEESSAPHANSARLLHDVDDSTVASSATDTFCQTGSPPFILFSSNHLQASKPSDSISPLRLSSGAPLKGPLWPGCGMTHPRGINGWQQRRR